MERSNVWGSEIEALANTIDLMLSETGVVTDDAPPYLSPDGVYDTAFFNAERNACLKAIALGVQALVLQAERDRREERNQMNGYE